MKNLLCLVSVFLAAALLLSGCSSTLSVEPSASPTPESDPTVVVLPSSDSEELGMSAAICDLSANSVAATLGECSGDIDVLKPTDIRATYYSLIDYEFEFVFEAEFPVIFTAERYSNGEVVAEDLGGIRAGDYEGYVEKYAGEGKWRRYTQASLGTPVDIVDSPFSDIAAATEGQTDIARLSAENTVRVKLPLADPGIYRYTLYFRKCIDYMEDTLTTGDEVYSVTLDVTVPKTEKDYDLLAAAILPFESSEDEEHLGEPGLDIGFLVRCNSGVDFFINMTKGGVFEKYDSENDSWTEVENGMAVIKGEVGDVMSGGGKRNGGIAQLTMELYPPSLSGRYRYTPAFVNAYGRRYENTAFYFEFGE